MTARAEIDHIFVFARDHDGLIDRLRAMGLVETYRRRHPGQGTQNICYAFDNAYLEVLFLISAEEAESPAIRRTGLLERSLWRERGTNPFGIAWRSAPDATAEPDFAQWVFRPPYLPETLAIDVAEDGDDPRLPMVFRFPGTTAPYRWTAERRGTLQNHAGLSAITDITVTLPPDVPPGPSLRWLAAHGALRLDPAAGLAPELAMTLTRHDGGRAIRLTLPSATTVDL